MVGEGYTAKIEDKGRFREKGIGTSPSVLPMRKFRHQCLC